MAIKSRQPSCLKPHFEPESSCFGGFPGFTAAPCASWSSVQVARIQFETTGALEWVPSRWVAIFKIIYILCVDVISNCGQRSIFLANFTAKPLFVKLLRKPETGADARHAAVVSMNNLFLFLDHSGQLSSSVNQRPSK